MKLQTIFAISFSTLFLAACGGGGSSTETSSPELAKSVNIIGSWDYYNCYKK